MQALEGEKQANLTVLFFSLWTQSWVSFSQGTILNVRLFACVSSALIGRPQRWCQKLLQSHVFPCIDQLFSPHCALWERTRARALPQSTPRTSLNTYSCGSQREAGALHWPVAVFPMCHRVLTPHKYCFCLKYYKISVTSMIISVLYHMQQEFETSRKKSWILIR